MDDLCKGFLGKIFHLNLKQIIPRAKFYHFIRKFYTVSFREGIDNLSRVLYDTEYSV